MEPRVDSDWLRERLRLGGDLWSEVVTVAGTGSTNADLAERARRGAPSGSVLVADFQSRGRGRFARVWEAPPGSSIAISVLLRPAGVPASRWMWLPLVTGLAVAAGLRAEAGVPAEVKWPNDVLIGGRKVCGILSERVETPQGPGAVIGMGINTELRAEDLPVATATSLAIEGATASAQDVALGVLTHLEGWYRRWLAGEDLRDAYAAGCTSIGRRVRVIVSPAESVEGMAEAVDEYGRLVVRHGGRSSVFSAGDVMHLR